MQKEVKMMKTLIIKSGKQVNNFIMSEEAIRQIYSEHNEGKPLLDKINYSKEKVCGYLQRTELARNPETGELELWGYFIYDVNDKTFDKYGECSYEIVYRHEDMDKNNILHKASLCGCVMVNKMTL